MNALTPQEMQMCTYDVFVSQLAKPMANITENYLHMALGMAGEQGELQAAILLADNENICEELGDYLFYATGFANFLGTSVTEVRMQAAGFIADDAPFNQLAPLPTKMQMLNIATADLLDMVKKRWAYNKAVGDEELEKYLGRCIYYFERICENLKFPEEFLEETNRKKLMKRYSGKYSDSAAQARADKQ